jgi:hypothetical protein
MSGARAAIPSVADSVLAQGIEDNKVGVAELADPAVIRLLAIGQVPEGQVLVEGALDPAEVEGAHAVGIEQRQRIQPRGMQHLHPRVKAILPTHIHGMSGDRARERSSHPPGPEGIKPDGDRAASP